MVFAVAGQTAFPVIGLARRRRCKGAKGHLTGVEIDQRWIILRSMRVVTGIAGCADVAGVFAVAAAPIELGVGGGMAFCTHCGPGPGIGTFEQTGIG